MGKFLSKFQGRGIKIDRVNSICVATSMIFYKILRAIASWVTSSWAIVFFAWSLRLLPIVYILWAPHYYNGVGTSPSQWSPHLSITMQSAPLHYNAVRTSPLQPLGACIIVYTLVSTTGENSPEGKQLMEIQ